MFTNLTLNNILARPNYLPFRKLFWKFWYNIFASRYVDINIVYINYGYANISNDAEYLELPSSEEQERYCIQLYHHVASAIPLEGLDVLEVGCGRGGGSSYIKRYLKPKMMVGVDFSQSNIEYCQNFHFVTQLKFVQGDAESLPFSNSLFDVIVNIESSHCYGSIEKFYDEVFRVLRPNGYFLFADFRPKEAVTKTRKQLIASGFRIFQEENITQNVLKAMDLEHERKMAIINESIPKYLHTLAKYFAGNRGTPMYEAFKNGEQVYLCYVLQK